jgi:class 3 adenylate cyclase
MVTFLFTDIEGSTRRWEANPQTMRAVMERHDELLTDAIETNGGRVVLERGEGDSFFAVFERPAAASGEMALAARLEGASDHHRQSIGFEMQPPWAERLNQEWSAVITRSLPEAEERREEGRRLTLDQAVDLALGDVGLGS